MKLIPGVDLSVDKGGIGKHEAGPSPEVTTEALTPAEKHPYKSILLRLRPASKNPALRLYLTAPSEQKFIQGVAEKRRSRLPHRCIRLTLVDFLATPRQRQKNDAR